MVPQEAMAAAVKRGRGQHRRRPHPFRLDPEGFGFLVPQRQDPQPPAEQEEDRNPIPAGRIAVRRSPQSAPERLPISQ